MAADGKHSTAATKAITQHQDENERELFAVFFCKELFFFFLHYFQYLRRHGFERERTKLLEPSHFNVHIKLQS